jgi:D-glycero-alpha-D-manno-heptose 1-phosphate guanylyltransferase
MRDISDITAAILVGGHGTRLQPVVSDRPKVLALVRGRPFLAYLLDQLMSLDISEVVFCSGYMSDKIQECFRDSYGSLRLLYSREEKPLGTGGAIRLAMPYFRSDTVLVMNGDSYIDVDLEAYLNWFRERERRAALVLTKAEDTSRYGTVCVDGDRITAFEEKKACSGLGWINAGIYLLKRSLVSSIPAGKFYSLEHEFFPSLTGGELYGFCVERRFIDIGTPEAYTMAEEFFASKAFGDLAGK